MRPASRGFKRFTLPRYALLDHTSFDDALQRVRGHCEIAALTRSEKGSVIVSGDEVLLRQAFLALPKELEEAARIDGAGSFRIFWSIMLPLIRPALAALAVITAMTAWNDLLWPLVVNTDPETMPISAGLTSLKGQYETNYPVMMAGSLIASLPMLLVYVLLQRHFVQSVAFSGSKG